MWLEGGIDPSGPPATARPLADRAHGGAERKGRPVIEHARSVAEAVPARRAGRRP